VHLAGCAVPLHINDVTESGFDCASMTLFVIVQVGCL
jgi:hypothetical protein